MVDYVCDHVKEKLELALLFIQNIYVEIVGHSLETKCHCAEILKLNSEPPPFIIGRYPQNLTEISNFCSKNSNFGQTNQIVQFNGILNLTAGKSRQGTITSLVPVSSNQNDLEMIEKDGFLTFEKLRNFSY